MLIQMCLDGNRENITTIETVSADGFVLPPVVIMKGKSATRQWITGSLLPPETLWCHSDKGWTDDMLGVEYIKHFDKNTQSRWLVQFSHQMHFVRS